MIMRSAVLAVMALAQMCPAGRLPGATHMIPHDDPTLFNATVDRFFRTLFVKTDRVAGLMKTGARMRADYAAAK